MGDGRSVAPRLCRKHASSGGVEAAYAHDARARRRGRTARISAHCQRRGSAHRRAPPIVLKVWRPVAGLLYARRAAAAPNRILTDGEIKFCPADLAGHLHRIRPWRKAAVSNEASSVSRKTKLSVQPTTRRSRISPATSLRPRFFTCGTCVTKSAPMPRKNAVKVAARRRREAPVSLERLKSRFSASRSLRPH